MPETDGNDAKDSRPTDDVTREEDNATRAIVDNPNGTADQESQRNDVDTNLAQSRELTPPPLPPRPPLSQSGSLRLSKQSSRPQLLSTPTTALSSTNVHTQTYAGDASPRSSPASKAISRKHSFTHFGRFVSNGGISDGDDSASIKSCIPSLDARLDGESILGDVGGGDGAPDWQGLNAQNEKDDPFETVLPEDEALDDQIEHEFDDVTSLGEDGTTEDDLLLSWKAKLKHFFILSASGKPIYSRHGDDQQISHYVGVAQTLISMYLDQKDSLKSFHAGGTQFVMLSRGPLNLVAISRLPESEAQLRNQLESLYMQILSTLTLPSMETMFRNRPSTDLRRPLQGTDVLLDGLADGFTRGSPSTLLSALECLRLRKTQRRTINDSLLKVRSQNLLYGLIVAAGRLVSVVRPKKHSLHPGDLHLIFNMLFEAGSVRAGGGENWIPLCLPGFNNTGFLYMYVSFFATNESTTEAVEERQSDAGKDDELAIVLISANKEAFFELRKMRDQLISQLEANGSMTAIKTAIRKGHAPCSEIVPGTALRHFLYKSRGNVQFVMPSFEPHFTGTVARRRLMNLYSQLHESTHSRTAHLKVQHSIANDSTALAWETPLFELYCVAGPNTSRAALAQGANKVVQWIRREEERVFIIGGAVF
ncbi:Vacuolar fusion protein MON1 [Pseudocercospora fuligena]|uniref:Vacuolar fusion protein MON1 n=1 Tax=Pseudocercospora fuligena TaxID=685502 RepID=A0A8H6VHC8_9PEZI|nr:Vacuolar fusion protein MON1 [Pseudocercospora fuligena]